MDRIPPHYRGQHVMMGIRDNLRILMLPLSKINDMNLLIGKKNILIPMLISFLWTRDVRLRFLKDNIHWSWSPLVAYREQREDKRRMELSWSYPESECPEGRSIQSKLEEEATLEWLNTNGFVQLPYKSVCVLTRRDNESRGNLMTWKGQELQPLYSSYSITATNDLTISLQHLNEQLGLKYIGRRKLQRCKRKRGE